MVKELSHLKNILLCKIVHFIWCSPRYSFEIVLTNLCLSIMVAAIWIVSVILSLAVNDKK